VKIETEGYTPPSAKELRSILKEMNLTITSACKLSGITQRTMQRYMANSGHITSMPYPILFTLLARAGWGMVHPDTWRHQVAHKLTKVAA
jgi:hypothetical protein